MDRQMLIYLAIIVLAALKQLIGVTQHLDIPFFDETEYLQKGFELSERSFNDWGPSYNLWYFVLSKFSENAVQTFYLNYSLLMLIIPVLLFLFLIHYRVDRNLSLLFALSFTMQPLLVSNFTYVSHFCLMAVLTAFIFIARVRSTESKLVIAMTAAYVCMYARQEFLLIFISLLACWLLVMLVQKRLHFSLSYLMFFSAVLLLFVIFGFISFQAQGIDRSLFAFLQHFYTNYIFWTKTVLTKDEFDAMDIFKGSTTMFQCLLANPQLFLKHIGTNMLNYGINLFKYYEDFLLPSPIFHYLGKGKHGLFILINGYFAFLLFRKKVMRKSVDFIQQHMTLTLLIVIFFAWSYFAIFFIFPERHYIILHFFWFILLLGFLLNGETGWMKKKWLYFPVVLLLLLFVPCSKSITYYHNLVIDSKQQPNLKTIRYLTEHNTQEPTVLFTTERGFEAYLPDNYRELFLEQDDVRPYIKNGDIDIQQFFTDKKVDIIFMNEKLQRLIQQTLGEKGELLLNDPGKMGFRKQIINPTLHAYLLIKTDEY
jgi:hypothetical protein